MVAQRQVFEDEIDTAIKNKNYDQASDLLDRYRALVTPQDVKNRMADEETRLKSQSVDKRELASITSMFGVLREALSARVGESIESDLMAKLQAARQREAGSE